MSKRFNELVTDTLEVERELRVLTPGRASLRCFIAECLSRAGATYEEVEAVKARLADPEFERQSGTGAYVRHFGLPAHGILDGGAAGPGDTSRGARHPPIWGIYLRAPTG